MLAIVRPDDWNLPLLLHVGGAMVLVGALVTAAAFLVSARGGGAAPVRLGFRTLLYAAIPAYLVMRISAQWVASEENVDDAEVAWIEIGYASTDAGIVLLIAAAVAAGMASRRAGRGEAPTRATAVASAVTLLLVAVYLVTVWAMTAKPA